MATKKNIFLHTLFTTIIIAAVLLSAAVAQAPAQYQLRINYVDKDSSYNTQPPQLQTSFATQPLCIDYVNKLPALLALKGYIAASVDSFLIDSNFAQINLFIGRQQNWAQINTDSIDKKALDESGFIEKKFINKPVNFMQLQLIKERILNYYDNNGYPFASIFLDSIRFNENKLAATLKVRKGPLYHIDSISVKGKVKISNPFLQRYLGLPNGIVYNKEKLESVGKRILELPYLQEVQPAELRMLGTGSVLNLYSKTKTQQPG